MKGNSIATEKQRPLVEQGGTHFLEIRSIPLQQLDAVQDIGSLFTSVAIRCHVHVGRCPRSRCRR